MDTIEYSWPRVDSTESCFGYEHCKNPALASREVIGSDEIQRDWNEIKERLLKIL